MKDWDISSLHTFGRDMKHNPHIHTLVAECTIDNTKKRKPFSYFNYETLRKAFMNQVLKRMYKYFKRNKLYKDLIKFNDIRKNLYHTKDNGFYVNAPQKEVKNKNQIKQIVNYVYRYQGHPAISETRFYLTIKIKVWYTITMIHIKMMPFLIILIKSVDNMLLNLSMNS